MGIATRFGDISTEVWNKLSPECRDGILKGKDNVWGNTQRVLQRFRENLQPAQALKADEFRLSRQADLDFAFGTPTKKTPNYFDIVDNNKGYTAWVKYDKSGREITRIATPDTGRNVYLDYYGVPTTRSKDNLSQAIKYISPEFQVGNKTVGGDYIKYLFDGEGRPISAATCNRLGEVQKVESLPQTYLNGNDANFFKSIDGNQVSSYSY